MAEPPALTIRRSWSRPDPSAVEALRGVPTGFIVDVLGRSGALDWRIHPIWDGPAFIGSALPVATTARDNLAPYAALSFAQHGDVLVVASGEYEGASIMGDILIGMARNAGIVAAVTDGLVRDVGGITEVGIPVYARGLSPNSPFKHGPGTIGLPVSLGGVVVEAGDIVLGDRDGIVVVPRGRIGEAIDGLAEIRAKEAQMDDLVRSGAREPGWLATMLAGGTVRYLD